MEKALRHAAEGLVWKNSRDDCRIIEPTIQMGGEAVSQRVTGFRIDLPEFV